MNALVPSGVPPGLVQIVVGGPAGNSPPYIGTVEALRPGLLAVPIFQVNGKQNAVAVFPDWQTFVLPVGAIAGINSRAAKPGDTIILFGVGFGDIAPQIAAGTLVSNSNSLASPVEFWLGNAKATVTYAGLAPGFAGLYEFNVVVPNVPDSAAVPLMFTLGGKPGTQTLYIAVQR